MVLSNVINQFRINVTETNTFTSKVIIKTYRINHEFNCEENCVVYLLTFNTVVFSMLGKLLLTFVTDGAVIRINVENFHVIKIVYKSIYMITMCLVIKILLIRSQ